MEKDPRFTPPERLTRRDKLNRYWPNVLYPGAGVVGLAECTAQVNYPPLKGSELLGFTSTEPLVLLQ